MAAPDEVIKRLYNAFDPFRPLPAGDRAYVDCQSVRGDLDVRQEIGSQILLSDAMTCYLYGGHRGAGKSTELKRLKQYLEENKCFVVYFEADEDDVDPEDAQYTDILLASTRHLLEDLSDADPTPLLSWLRERWQGLQDLAQTEIKFENLSVQEQIGQFSKLTANIRAVPTLRSQIRNQVNPHTVTLLEALNTFIKDAKNKLPYLKEQLVVIADNLDRIVSVAQDDGRTNHEDIYVDRAEQLKALDCHTVYTVPISLLYSERASDLREIYTDTDVLPMIMVQTPNGELYEPGFAKLKDVIYKRVEPFVEGLSLENGVFDSAETLERLCIFSGGHVRNLMLLMRSAISYAGALPLTKRAVQRAITQSRDTYRRTVQGDQWKVLAQVARTHQITNDAQHRALLFNRCLLEYREETEDGEILPWYDVHPLIRGIDQFKQAYGNATPT
ncbi:MAG: ATP-binding protein [Cyanobacteria bacterium J06635_15]